MIGEPTNFVHTAHVGSGDLFSGMNSVSTRVEQVGGAWGAVRCACLASALCPVNCRHLVHTLNVSVKRRNE